MASVTYEHEEINDCDTQYLFADGCKQTIISRRQLTIKITTKDRQRKKKTTKNAQTQTDLSNNPSPHSAITSTSPQI